MAVLISAAISTAYANARKLVRLADGTIYCVYSKSPNGAWQIYIKKSVDDGLTWTGETLLSTYAGMDTRTQVVPAIAADSSGNLHVVWHGFATGFAKYQIWYTKFNGIWSETVRISDKDGMTGDHQRYPSIAVDESDNVHVVWDGVATGFALAQIYYTKYDGSWSAPLRISTLALMQNYEQAQASIAIDSLGYLHVTWWGKATGFTGWNQVWYTKYDGSWSAPLRISTLAQMQNYSQAGISIAIDSNNFVHVVFYGAVTGGASRIWYTKYDGSWSAPLQISTLAGMDAFQQQFPTVAIDASDNVHVVWYGKSNAYPTFQTIFYAKYTGSWAVEYLQSAGVDLTSPNCRWSLIPAGNIPFAGMSYTFHDPTYVYYDAKDIPTPPKRMIGLNPAFMEVLGL